MNVAIKHIPAVRVATVHHIGPYSRISEAFGRLHELAGGVGALDVKPTLLALYYDDPELTPEAELRADAGVAVPEGVELPTGLDERRLPAGRYACTLHVGPYEQLGDAWSRFKGQWLSQSGERLAEGASFERYLNNPLDVPKAELQTELYFPLARSPQ